MLASRGWKAKAANGVERINLESQIDGSIKGLIFSYLWCLLCVHEYSFGLWNMRWSQYIPVSIRNIDKGYWRTSYQNPGPSVIEWYINDTPFICKTVKGTAVRPIATIPRVDSRISRLIWFLLNLLSCCKFRSKCRRYQTVPKAIKIKKWHALLLPLAQKKLARGNILHSHDKDTAKFLING